MMMLSANGAQYSFEQRNRRIHDHMQSPVSVLPRNRYTKFAPMNPVAPVIKNGGADKARTICTFCGRTAFAVSKRNLVWWCPTPRSIRHPFQRSELVLLWAAAVKCEYSLRHAEPKPAPGKNQHTPAFRAIDMQVRRVYARRTRIRKHVKRPPRVTVGESPFRRARP